MSSGEKTSKKLFNAKRVVIAILIILIMSAAGIFVYAKSILNSKNIYEGVCAGGTDLGGLSESEAERKLEEHVKSHSDITLKFNCDDIEFEIPASSLSFEVNVKETVKKAYNCGRNKGMLENLKNIMSFKKEKYSVDYEISFDEDILLLTVNEKIQNKTSDPIPMSVEIGEDRLYVTNAVPGMGIESKPLAEQVKKRLSELNAGKSIALKITEIEPENLSPEEFCKKYNREAQDAVYTKTDDGHKIEPEIVGIKLDNEEAKRILEENKDNKETYEIPAQITKPAVTAKQLEDKYVNHIIASYTTSFAGSSANRCANIALAASKINGYVINPGKRFSYNGVVGPRTVATGFKTAHVYVGTQVAEGIGGGICQVSSTLYNAVVMADLKIISRTNHSIPVSYTPLGRDATVSYGSIDFVFENNKSYPVSVKATVSGQSITVAIVGAETPDYTVEFATEYVKAIPFTTETTEDASLAQGQTKVISNGSNGSVVNSYRVYKKNGSVYKKEFEAKSTYSAVAKKVVTGAAPKAPEPISPLPDNTQSTPEVQNPVSENSTPDTQTTAEKPNDSQAVDVPVVKPEDNIEQTEAKENQDESDDPLAIE